MAGARVQVHCAATVVLGSLVLVADYHANWGTEGDTEFRSRLDFHAVLLISRGRQSALTGTSPGHLRLNISLSKLHSRRAAIDDAADGAAVGFTVAGGGATCEI